MTQAELFSRARRAISPRARRPPFDFVGRGRGAGRERRAAALPRRARRRPAERPLLRRRPRPAHLPAAVLVEVARRRHPRPLADAARQLPDVAPDPDAGRPAARASRSPTWTATRRTGAARSRSSTARRPRSACSTSRRGRVDGGGPLAGGAGARRACAPHEIGVFVRSRAELRRARAAVEAAGLPFKVLDEHVETASGTASRSAPCTSPRAWSSAPSR